MTSDSNSVHVEMDSILRRIVSLESLAIPKGTTPYGQGFVHEVFGNAVKETDHTWFVPCSHQVAPPATSEQLRTAATLLGTPLPAQLAEFLRLYDGAKLFVAQRLGLVHLWPGSLHVRYHLFGSAELSRINAGLLENFQECLGNAPPYQHHNRLNYVAFGDAGNADYYGIGLEGERKDQVFLVHHELTYAPYVGDGSEFLYYPIADSLRSWFKLILDTGGWGGRGEDCGVL